MERVSLNTLSRVERKEQYHVDISNRLTALENMDVEVYISRAWAWEMIRENIQISAKESLGQYELKKYKAWFDEGCSKLLDQKQQSK
jgi:hypothetical protein